jgi:hypothetical protein
MPLTLERKIHDISKEPYYMIYSLVQRTQDEFLAHVRGITDQMNVDDQHVIMNYNQISSRDIAAHELVCMQRVLDLPMSDEQQRVVDFIIERHAGAECFRRAKLELQARQLREPLPDHNNEPPLPERLRLTTSVMLTGIPGTGKSSIGAYVNFRYKQLFPNESVMLVYGFDPTVPCLNIIHHVIQQRSHQSEVMILVLDEFDKSMEYAMRDNAAEGFPQSSHARNKQQLTGFLDLINNNMPNSIVIGTSNKNWEELRQVEDGAFVRRGRFNHHFQLEQLYGEVGGGE